MMQDWQREADSIIQVKYEWAINSVLVAVVGSEKYFEET